MRTYGGSRRVVCRASDKGDNQRGCWMRAASCLPHRGKHLTWLSDSLHVRDCVQRIGEATACRRTDGRLQPMLVAMCPPRGARARWYIYYVRSGQGGSFCEACAIKGL